MSNAGCGVVWPQRERVRELEDLLREERHLAFGVRLVERNGIRNHLAREWHARARRQIVAQVVAKLVDQHEELSIGGRELEPGGIQVDDGRARGFDRSMHFIECGTDLHRCGVDALTRETETRTPQAIAIQEFV